MMSKSIIAPLFTALVMLAWACVGDGAEKQVQGIQGAGGEIADIIRNPVTQDQVQMDTSQLAKLSFEEKVFHFGTVDEGAVIEHEFLFTNTGNTPLLITDVRSTCGCTVAEWPGEPIPPGGKGSIPVRFNTKGKDGHQDKPVTITANTFPAQTILHVKGTVE